LPEGMNVLVQDRQGQCRICLETGGDLIAPCCCSGSSKWIHRKCLNQWRASRQNPRSLTNCCECGFAYVLDLHRIINDEGAARQRRFVRQIAAQGVASFAGLQILIGLVALLIRACDPQEELVDIFDFHQDANSQGKDFYNALLYHKTTYYVAAVLALLAGLGLFGVIAGLAYLCCGRSSGASRGLGGGGPVYHCDAWDMYICSDCTHSCSYSCARCMTPPRGDTECCGNCCHGCDCSQCNLSAPSGDGDSAKVCGVIMVAALIALVIIGVFIALVMFILALQRAAQQYAKLQQVRVLAEEYVVRDLADPSDLGGDPDHPAPGGVSQQQMADGATPLVAGPTVANQAFMAPDPEFQQRMQCMISRDIRAIYEGPDPSQALSSTYSAPDVACSA